MEDTKPTPSEPVPSVAAADPQAEQASTGAALPPATGSALPEAEIERMTADIIAALKTVYDPEIPSDIYELGLIYRIDIEDDRTVAHIAGLSRRWRNARLGPERRQLGRRRQPYQGQPRLRPALAPRPHVGRSPARFEYVLKCMRECVPARHRVRP
jgi:Iron-sulfur cluster assembly protein